MRCVPPAHFANVLQEFDSTCSRLLKEKVAPQAFREPLPSFAKKQMTLPNTSGGLGLVPAAVTSLTAFFASFANSIQDVQHLILPDHLDPNSEHVPIRFRQLIDSAAELRKNGVTLDGLPSTPSQVGSCFGHGGPGRLQSKLMANLHRQLRTRLLSDPANSNVDKARLIAASAPLASSWLQLDRRISSSSLSNSAVATAVAHRLGVSSVPLRAHRCVCKKPLDAVHLHACNRNKRRGILARHDKVKYALAYVCRQAGADVQVEPSTWVGDSSAPDEDVNDGEKLVSDLRVVGFGEPDEVDIAIVCAQAPSHCDSVVQRKSCQTVFERRPSEKETKYRRLIDKGVNFHVFLLSSTGGWSDGAKAFVRRVSQHAADHNPFFDFTSFHAWAVSIISCALQEGNYVTETQGVALQHYRPQ